MACILLGWLQQICHDSGAPIELAENWSLSQDNLPQTSHASACGHGDSGDGNWNGIARDYGSSVEGFAESLRATYRLTASRNGGVNGIFCASLCCRCEWGIVPSFWMDGCFSLG